MDSHFAIVCLFYDECDGDIVLIRLFAVASGKVDQSIIIIIIVIIIMMMIIIIISIIIIHII